MVHRMKQEAVKMHKRPSSLPKLRTVPKQFSWVDQRLVRAHSIDQLSHAACTLYLFLGYPLKTGHRYTTMVSGL